MCLKRWPLAAPRIQAGGGAPFLDQCGHISTHTQTYLYLSLLLADAGAYGTHSAAATACAQSERRP